MSYQARCRHSPSDCLYICRLDNYEMTQYYLNNFKQLWNDENLLRDVTDEVADYISDLYKE